MGNLGWYQLLTTLAKKVGGPKNLLLLTAGGGYVIIRTIEAGGKKVVKLIRNKTDNKKVNYLSTHDVNETKVDENGVVFTKGDIFNVIAVDGDSVLIEIVNHNDNPYFVSSNFLKSISNLQ